MPSRLIKDLHPKSQAKFLAFAGLMAQEGIPFMLTRTKCSQEEQNELFEQGRSKPGFVVTWTKKSKHIEGRAFDIAILKDGKPTWDLKVSVDGDDIPDYLEAAKIGKKVGLRAGADFKDYPHFEDNEVYKE